MTQQFRGEIAFSKSSRIVRNQYLKKTIVRRNPSNIQGIASPAV
jgi:hypothetical protein